MGRGVSVLEVGLGVVQVSTDLLQMVPVAGLGEAARLIAKIWEAIQAVKVRAEYSNWPF